MLAVVVGSSRGIGLELVVQLGSTADVLALDTYLSDELTQLVERGEGVSYRQADVTDLESIRAALAHLEAGSVDRVFVVAGVLGCTEPLLADGRSTDASLDLMRVFSVNTIGPLNSVRACDKLLKEHSKVVLISSTMGSLHTATHDLNPTYSVSKAGLNMLSRKLAVELKPRRISVVAMSPGVVRTEMTSGVGDISPQESVSGMLRTLEGSDISGRFLRYDGSEWSW